MFKLRINPSERQILKFNTNDLNDEVIDKILLKYHGWEANYGVLC